MNPLQSTPENCPICMDSDCNYIMGCCNQEICKTCIRQLSKCPFCRAKIGRKAKKEMNEPDTKYKKPLLDVVALIISKKPDDTTFTIQDLDHFESSPISLEQMKRICDFVDDNAEFIID